jgi:hypothetical protein
MPRLDCISILEAGSFGSDSGTIVIPSGETSFPISAFVGGFSRGSSFGYAVDGSTFTAIYDILTEDGDHLLLEDGGQILTEG